MAIDFNAHFEHTKYDIFDTACGACVADLKRIVNSDHSNPTQSIILKLIQEASMNENKEKD